MAGKNQHQVSVIHHYLPIFYTKRWVGADGRVCTFTKPYKGIVKHRRLHPSATGFECDLYGMKGLSDELKDQFERLFLGPADSDAADALFLLESKIHRWEARNRNGWSRFMMSLMVRMPEDVQNLKTETERSLRASDPELDARYKELKLQDDPQTFAEWLDQNDPHVFSNASFQLLKSLMDNEKVGQDLNSLHWFTIPTPKARFDLLTSDGALIRSPFFGRRDGYLLLPIGPRLLFAATRDDAVSKRLMRRKDDDLVTMVNRAVVRSARLIVIGTDITQLEYVQRNMGAEPTVRLMDRYRKR